MQTLKSLGLLTLLFSMALFVVSCGGNASQEAAEGESTESMEAAAHGEGKAYTSEYVCPMHCEGSGSEEPGECPVCGMQYVAQADHTNDGHSH